MAKLDDDTMRVVRRNELLGMWAAAKLGLVGESAEAYSNDLAMAALEVERGDVLAKLRNDFNDAGVVQSDEQLLQVMSEFWLRASSQRRKVQGMHARLRSFRLRAISDRNGSRLRGYSRS